MDVVKRLTPAPIVTAVRRLSGNQDEIGEHLNRPATNEYFQQAYRAQHPEEMERDGSRRPSAAREFIDGIRDRLSPAGAMIGEAIRKWSKSDSDMRTSQSQIEYLTRLHEAAVAEQNRRGARDDPDDTDEYSTLDIMSEIKDRIGDVVRRLSNYDDKGKKLTARETFHFFQRSDSKGSGPPTRTRSRDSNTLPKRKKKKKTWRELFSLVRLKRQVVISVTTIPFLLGNCARETLYSTVCSEWIQ